ncbi:Sec20-domain-containing protein [Amylocystis lapponica]|nr:Sec20-domain-containing protein [Amylocystis lapponica]
MPPLPSTLNEETTSLVSLLKRRHADLADFQIPRLRSCKGPLATQQRFAAELREDTDSFARQLETLDIAVDDQRSERDQRELRRVVDEFRAALASLRKDMRAALLASKRALDADQLSSRDELMRSSAAREKRDLDPDEKVAEDALMKANNDVTEALQRTITLMQGELERSVLSTQLLDTSSAALRSTSTTHDVLDGFMVTSKHLITALQKSDWLDRMLVLAGLAFFVVVVLFILKQRLVDRSLRIAFWWTRFIPDFGGDEALVRMEAGDALGKGVAGAVSTVLATATASSATVAGLAASGQGGADAPSAETLDASLLEGLRTQLWDPVDVSTGSPISAPSSERTLGSSSSSASSGRMHEL